MKSKIDLAKSLELKYPLIVAPMAGGPSSVDLVVASSEKGALGSIGSAYSTPETITQFVKDVRAKTNRPFGINLFIPERLKNVELRQIESAIQATEKFRKELSLPRPQLQSPYEEDFDSQFEAVMQAKPKLFSYVFGLLEPNYIKALRAQDIIVVGTATSLNEAMRLVESGVDAIVVQGIEAGGHRGIFNSEDLDPEVRTLDLIKAIRPKTSVSLIAAGGIMCAHDIQIMLKSGADLVQMGTAFLCTKEAGTSVPYRKELLQPKRMTKTTRAFSGRFARGIENRFMKEIDLQPESILPFPAQNKFTRDLRNTSAAKGLSDFLSLWSGSGSGDLWTGSTSDLIDQLFS